MAGWRGDVGFRGPPPPPPPPQHAPPFRVDREKVCPLLLRVFPRLGGNHRAEDFSGALPSGEFQIYTWPDATLGELADLVREVAPAAGKQLHKLTFQLIYPDRHGKMAARAVGAVFTRPGQNGPLDDERTLHSLQFVTGDYLDVGVFEAERRR